VTANKITSTCCDGKEHHLTLAKDAKVTCDGKVSKLEDLKVGTPVCVTACENDKTKTSRVAAGSKTPAATRQSYRRNENLTGISLNSFWRNNKLFRNKMMRIKSLGLLCLTCAMGTTMLTSNLCAQQTKS